MFVTAVAGVLDLASGELAFALAGHEPPVLVPAGGAAAALSVEGGRVLGLIEASDFPVNRLRLGAGDAVVLYTDGVSEAQDAAAGSSASSGSSRRRPRCGSRGHRADRRSCSQAVRAFAGRGAAVGRHHHPDPAAPGPGGLSASRGGPWRRTCHS